MLLTNIARMILSRAYAYLQNKNALFQNMTPSEIDADYELSHDIAFDPNIPDDSPMDNLLKRYRCQVELYQAVNNLRQGRYYANSYSDADGIVGFERAFAQYNWVFFDSPDMYGSQDIGSLLRRLLAVFSCRPSFTQLSSFSPRYGLGFTTVSGLAKTTFINIPIINVRLPIDLIGGSQPHTVHLARAMTQTDFILEHKSVVPKNKSVIYSNEVAIFYANRLYPSVQFAGGPMSFRTMSMPISFINQTTVNKSLVNYENRFRIGREWFSLRSVVTLQRPPINSIDLPLGYAAAIVVDGASPSNLFGGQTSYVYYNPSIASVQIFDGNQPGGQNQYVANTPVSYIDEITNDPTRIGFRTEVQERGTIFVYVSAGIRSN